MRIVSRTKKESHRFVVLKGFVWEGRTVQVGEEIEIKEQPDQDGMVKRGLVRPVDLVDGLIYVALRPFHLPGKTLKFEAKALELVSLKAEDALRLMLDRAVLPRDSEQWRPYKMKLGAAKEILRGKRLLMVPGQVWRRRRPLRMWGWIILQGKNSIPSGRG